MSTGGNSKFMNSLLPLNSGATNTKSGKWSNWFSKSSTNTISSNTTSSPVTGVTGITGIIVFMVIVLVIVGTMYYFKDKVSETWNNAKEMVTGYFNPKAPSPSAAPSPSPSPSPDSAGAGGSSDHSHTDVTHPSDNKNEPKPSPSSVINKVLPGSGNEVFNVSSNRYTYYDAEPLCKALGAELATYDQVKDAWNKGADWCNYGWVKGQMAIYPTSEETYQKLQGGPEDQRQACGRPGMNGGYFDNPEMRFGVTCVGNKPPQNKHDEAEAAKGAPLSPDALAFDKKVSQYKSEADHIALLPFNPSKWTS